eukprot:m.14117 g.14117  ORF g.14117 m.14117 type:complete len:107 (+) comp7512_c0_seq1:137-457(+)
MSEYLHVGGGLNLKGVKTKKKKSKKVHKDDKKLIKETIQQEVVDHQDDDLEMTAAERAFAREQAKREAARIREKASKTHKEKVQELNSKLDTMTEHHDIPKVSWTK